MALRTGTRNGARARTSGRQAGSAPRRRRLSPDTRSAAGFLSFNIAGFTLFTLVPVIYAIYISFFSWPLEGGRLKFVGLGNYRATLSSYGFWRIVINVLYFVGAYVTLNLIVSLTLASLLGPRVAAVKGKSLLRILFFLPVVTPLVASSLLWSLMYGQTGIINTALGWFRIGPVPWLSSTAWAMPSIIIMSVWLGFGYNMILFIAGMTNIPESLYDAAAIEGAGPFRQFFKITLPLLSPLVFFGTLLTLITSFQVFTQAYILTNGGPGNSSTTLVLQLYDEAFRYLSLGDGSAIGILLALMILVVTRLMFLLQRRFVYYEH